MARNITRYEPVSDLIRSGMFPDIGNFFREFGLPTALRGMESDLRIKLDVEETPQSYSVKAEVPGVKKEDMSVDISGNSVTIKAEVKQERADEKNGNVLHAERIYGEVMRSFTLPQEVDEANAEAKYENGILSLTLPKKQASATKKITVQ